MNKLKIILVIPSLAKGGAERMVVNTARALQKYGHDVKIIIFKNKITYPVDDLNVEITTIQINLSILKKSQIDVSQLQSLIDDFKPDIIHSHLFESEMALAHVSLSQKVKRMVHFHDNIIQMSRFSPKVLFSKRAFTNFYERLLTVRNLRKVDTKIISISKNTDDYAQKHFGHFLPVHLLLNAIDLQQFRPPNDKKEDGMISCAMIGSLVDKKGQELAIETIAELKKRNQFLKLYLIGDGPNRAKLGVLTKRLGLTDHIEFTGNMDQPEKILQEATFYLHTAKQEPFGLVILEAMACGLPVICTDGFGNRELIKENENGFMVWERDPQLLVEKIQFLIDNPEERARLGKGAHRFAQDFGMEKYVDNLIAIYTQ